MTAAIELTARANPQDILEMNGELDRYFNSIKVEVQGAMADAFYEVVMGNFGTLGFDRPWDWAPLSPAYARKVGRSYATLFVTGALKDSVKHESVNPDAASVWVSDGDVPYATAHHYGVASKNLPARRVFPVDLAGHVTQLTLDWVTDALREKLREVAR